MGIRTLIVVDVQNDFCEGGSLAVEGGSAVAEKLQAWVPQEEAYKYVVATKDWHPNALEGFYPGFTHFSENPDYADTWPSHCVGGTDGSKFKDPLRASNFVNVFYKGQNAAAYSGFEGHDVDGVTLAEWLREREVDEVDVVGIAFDYCVKATALDAIREGFNCNVLTEYTASVHPENDLATTQELRNFGVEVV